MCWKTTPDGALAFSFSSNGNAVLPEQFYGNLADTEGRHLTTGKFSIVAGYPGYTVGAIVVGNQNGPSAGRPDLGQPILLDRRHGTRVDDPRGRVAGSPGVVSWLSIARLFDLFPFLFLSLPLAGEAGVNGVLIASIAGDAGGSFALPLSYGKKGDLEGGRFSGSQGGQKLLTNLEIFAMFSGGEDLDAGRIGRAGVAVPKILVIPFLDFVFVVPKLAFDLPSASASSFQSGLPTT